MIPLLWLLVADLNGGIKLEAEYLVRCIPTSEGTLIAGDYLVVEGRFEGPKGAPLNVSSGEFALRINGKILISTETSGMVVNSMTRPEYSQHPVIEAAAGPMVISSRPSTQPMPLDTSAMAQRVQSVALPEGDLNLPVRGLLFFPYSGKTKKIKSIELIYEGTAGKTVLKLQ